MKKNLFYIVLLLILMPLGLFVQLELLPGRSPFLIASYGINLILAIIAGFVLKMPYFEMVTQLLPATEYHVHSATTYWIMTIGTQLFVMLAIFFAYKKYMSSDVKVPDGTSKMENSFAYKLLINQYYIPYFYEDFFF